MATFVTMWSKSAMCIQFDALAGMFGENAYYQWVYDVELTKASYRSWSWRHFRFVTVPRQKKWILDVPTPLQATPVVRRDDHIVFSGIASTTARYNGRILGARVWARRDDPEYVVFIPYRGTCEVYIGDRITIVGDVSVDMEFER